MISPLEYHCILAAIKENDMFKNLSCILPNYSYDQLILDMISLNALSYKERYNDTYHDNLINSPRIWMKFLSTFDQNRVENFKHNCRVDSNYLACAIKYYLYQIDIKKFHSSELNKLNVNITGFLKSAVCDLATKNLDSYLFGVDFKISEKDSSIILPKPVYSYLTYRTKYDKKWNRISAYLVLENGIAVDFYVNYSIENFRFKYENLQAVNVEEITVTKKQIKEMINRLIDTSVRSNIFGSL